MSRIGKKAVPVPAGVTASINGQHVSVKGPKGQLEFVLNEFVLVSMQEGAIKVGSFAHSCCEHGGRCNNRFH
jgi:large subunit ribosomal protein L6